MLYVNPDAVAQPAIVGEEKGSSRDSSTIPLISAADEMCEENEETHVDVIKDKDNINPTDALLLYGEAEYLWFETVTQRMVYCSKNRQFRGRVFERTGFGLMLLTNEIIVLAVNSIELRSI
ncbi:hypothetical protein TNCT_380741 [Trichonephila clavata]|uniref:Uncharacterized protein n=1 Tax=Trichonephila clavata TaxID=2740835 RepID=A0A8X6KJG7_TRICU|nr:hypothetical protein TNCT_380741 [Trichonephila clavata]